MRLARLELRNFRNVANATLIPGSKLAFLLGDNGQGKTSFLEALSYLATLRSFRGAKNDEVIRWGEDVAEISATLTGEAGLETQLKVVFVRETQSGRVTKAAFVNGKAHRSSTSYLSQRFGQFELGFHAAVFNPADHDLVRGEPAIRRQYLDRVLAAENLEYLKQLTRYQRTLDQRNALLRGDGPVLGALIDGFTEPMVEMGAWIALRRLEWVRRSEKPLAEALQSIAPRQLKTTLIYRSDWVPKIEGLSRENKGLNPPAEGHFSGHQTLPSIELLQHSFRAQIQALRGAELRAQSSLVGPHRDDWAFLLGDEFLRGHGSQGEVRSALLALKLSEIELFRETTGHSPMLLLDDFSSELDRERRAFLMSYLQSADTQVVVTTTEDLAGVAPEASRFRIRNGVPSEVTAAASATVSTTIN